MKILFFIFSFLFVSQNSFSGPEKVAALRKPSSAGDYISGAGYPREFNSLSDVTESMNKMCERDKPFQIFTAPDGYSLKYSYVCVRKD